MIAISQHVLLYGLNSAGQAVPLLVSSDGSISGSGSSTPSGAAGGDLTGTYPNPTIDALKVTAAKLAADAVTTTKILDSNVTSRKVNLDYSQAVITTNQTTTSTSFVDLATVGPSVTLTTGVTQTHLIDTTTWTYINSVAFHLHSPNPNGAGANDVYSSISQVTNEQRMFGRVIIDDMPSPSTHGSKYRVSAQTGGWEHRTIYAIGI